MQPKLLRALQEGEIQRVGSDALRRVDVRLLAATNRDLAAEVRDGRFRADLYHRLNVYPLRVPPLRERRDDIALLAGYFCDLARRRLGRRPGAPERRRRSTPCVAYDWPGNVRELENVLSRVTLRAAAAVPRGATVVIDAAPSRHRLRRRRGARPSSMPARRLRAPISLRDATLAFQRDRIRRALVAARRQLGRRRPRARHAPQQPAPSRQPPWPSLTASGARNGEARPAATCGTMAPI